MTLHEIQQSRKDMLSPQDVSGCLHCDPQLIRVMARDHPEKIRFPFVFIGNRMKIPRLSFLAFMGVGGQ